MKNLKRILSLVLVASFMVAGVSAMPVHAAENTGDTVAETLIRTDIATGEQTIIEIPALANLDANNDYNTSSYSPDAGARSVIGEDLRDEITNTTSSPYYAIAYLNVTFSNNKTYRGTGFMISKNVMLTAGHNLYEEGYSVTNITAYFGRSGDYMPKTATASTFYLDTKYTGSEVDWDYGIIVFNENVGNTTGWFGLHANTGTSSIGTSTVRVTGYPSDLPGRKMWTDTGTVSSITSYRFKHNADTYKGNSGSPTYFYNSTYGNQVVGIHTHGGNYSRRITMTLFDWLEDQGFIS